MSVQYSNPHSSEQPGLVLPTPGYGTLDRARYHLTLCDLLRGETEQGLLGIVGSYEA